MLEAVIGFFFGAMLSVLSWVLMRVEALHFLAEGLILRSEPVIQPSPLSCERSVS